ncbi:DivIVA domain-containing protein [Streptomyces qinzhouensis]|uniref:DivIVA domain-containing protein n=1 Tax=Streptomyces qinzhouensis TaxID=2599401 RepID=UPI003CCC4DFF
MFLFLLIAMVVVVGAVTLAVLGGGDSAALPEAAPERLVDPLPASRPVGRADVEALRLPVAPRGYRMADVDDALARLGAELAERDARIARLESVLAGARATAVGGRELFAEVATGAVAIDPAPDPDEDPAPGLDEGLDEDVSVDAERDPVGDAASAEEVVPVEDVVAVEDAGPDAAGETDGARRPGPDTAPEAGGPDAAAEGRDR